MADKDFLKFYKVLKHNIDSSGNLNPEAKLYPMYAGQYAWKRIPESEVLEQFNKPIEYDDKTNAHEFKPMSILDSTGKIIKEYTPKHRGFSALRYTSPEKNNGEHRLFVNGPEDKKERPQKMVMNTEDYYDMWNDSLDLNRPDEDTDNDIFWARVENMQDTLANDALGDVDNFVTVPVIVTADNEDVVSVNDILNKDYSVASDFPEEVLLKRIRSRYLPKRLFEWKEDDGKKVLKYSDEVLDEEDFPIWGKHTYSDSRLKNLVLSDKHKKDIYNDFVSFYNNRRKQNNIYKGIKELGQ